MKNKFRLVSYKGSRRLFIPSIFATALTFAFSVETTNAAALSWDGSDTVTTDAQGGTGNWNANSTANWWNGSADVVWPAPGGTDDDAVFDGTAGTVTLTSAITANDLTFNTTGYILSGAQTLTLNGTTPTITVDTGLSATIGNSTATVLAGSVGLTKDGLGTLVLNGSAANTYTGGTTVNAGTLGINGTGGNTRIAGALTVNASGTVETIGDGTGLGYNNQITSVSINGGIVTSAATVHVWNITGGVTMTGGTLRSNGGVSTLTGNQLEWNRTSVTTLASPNTATIGGRIRIRNDSSYTGISFTVAEGAATTDLLVSAGITEANGGMGITKSGLGLMALTAANNYTGATNVTAGTLTLNGANGSILLSAPVISGGATLKIDNTGAANNTNRLGDAVAITLNNATLQFSNDAAATTNFAETTGVVTANGGSTISTSQADVGQTSVLTLGGLVGSPNFIGTGLGVDARNRIFITGRVNGATVGLFNTTGVAVYDTTLGVVEATFTDVPFAGTIADAAASNIRLTGGVSGDVLLAASPTTVNSIFQNQTSATTVDNTAQILRLGASGGILLPTGMASLTIGTAADSGTLTAGGAPATAGTLNLTNNDATALLTVNSIIADNGAIVGVVTGGSGKIVLSGANTYTGTTLLGAATNEISGGTQTLGGIISGTGALLKTTSTGTLTLSGANTFTGATTINAGTLKLGNSAGLGSSPLVTIASGATLDVAGFNAARPVNIAGTGVGAIGALYNSSVTTGSTLGSLTLSANATVASAVPGADTAKLVGTGNLNLNGNTLTITGGAFNANISDITSGNININSGATLYSGSGGAQTSVTGTITINTGGIMDTRDTSNTAMTSVHTIALNGGQLGRGQITGNNGGGGGTTLKNNITVDSVNGGSILNSSSGGFGINYRLAGSISGSGPLTLGGAVGVEFQGDASGYSGTATATGGTVTFNPGIATQTFGGILAGSRPVVKSGVNTTTLAGPNTYTGTTSVSAGTLVLSGANTGNSAFTVASGATLRLDYTSEINSKLHDSSVLTLSGGTVDLANGASSHTEAVGSTTLTAGTASTVNQSSGSSILNLGAITRNTGSFLNFGQSGIARTTNLNNVNGILGTWATIGGSQFAMNDGTGLIVAATTTDLTRLSSGPKEIADGAINHVRFIEGTGTAGSFTLGSAITTINTLTQSAVGGTTAATVDLALQTLALNTITVGTGAGSLTIGSALNNGTLKSAGTAIEFRDLAAAGITVSSIIADGTGATTLTKTDPGVLTFAGTNSYTGGTIVNAGTLTASLGNTAGVRFPFGSGAITANSGTTLRFFAGSTTNAMTYGNAINLNAATLTSEDAVQTYSGNIALTGTNTVNVSYTVKDAIFSGVVSGAGSLTKASAGLLMLSGSNSYSGGTTLSAGTIRTTNTAALGAAGQSLTLNGGTLWLASDAALSSKNVTMGGDMTFTLDRASYGSGLTTTLGSLTSTSGNRTLTFNKGVNVADTATIAFGGTLSIGGATAAPRTTTFAVGSGAVVQLGPISSGAQYISLVKSGVGTLIIPSDYGTWDNGTAATSVTLSGGTLELRGTMGDSGDFRNLTASAGTTLRLANNASKDYYSGITAAAGMTIEGGRVTSAATSMAHTLGTLSLAGTLNVNRASTITGAGVATIAFNGTSTLTAAAAINVGSNAVLNLGAISGNFAQSKDGLGTLSIFGVSSSTGALTLNGGTTNLTGASGTVASTSGITINTGAVLTLNNTSAANNGNRIAGTFAMNGGTLNFTNNAGAVNYAETTGALSIGGGMNTIATGQAAVGQTSILTFASLARTAGTLNFSGTGLGTTVDTKNEIRFTTNPTLVNGIIGTWATVNGTDYATTTGVNNSIIAFAAYTDVMRLGVSSSTILDGAATNIRIIEGSGTAFPILLGSPTTTINTLNQSTFDGTGAATIDPDAINNTLAVNSILVSSGAGSLTIGTTAGDGTLKSAGTSLQVIENSSGGSTINSTITNGTALSTFTKSGSGTLTLTGTNTYTGATTIEGGILAVSVMANGLSNSGIGAAAVATGNLILNNGTLRYTGNTVSSNRGFTITAGTTGTVDVSTTSQTLTISGGIAATTGNLVKSGAGILTLSAASSHSGTTAVTGGKLTVSSTMLNSSAFSAGTGATLEFGATNIFVSGHGTALADSRVISVDGGTLLFNTSADFRFGNVTLSNGATWTSNRILTNYDALLANTVSGAATVRVTGNTASTMNGSGGIHLQGVQNFDVADVTASTATDLTVSMILAAQGTIGGAAGGVNKLGAGTISLQGANTYTGATNVVAGVLAIGAGGATQTSSTITVSSGATLRLDRNDTWGNHQATSSSPIVVNQGTLATNGNFNTIINPTLNGGTVTLNGGASASYPALAIKGTLTAGGTAASTINVGTGTNNFINIGPSGTAGTLIVDVADATASTATDLSINSVMQNNWNAAGTVQIASVLQKTGTGTLALTPAGGGNTFTGGLHVSNGLVLLTGTNSGNSVAGAGTLTIASGATVRAMSHNALGQGTGTLSPMFVNGGTFEGAEYNHINTITMTGGAIVPRSGITVVDGLDMKIYNTVNPSITTNASATTATISLKISNNSAGPLTATVADGAAANDLNISSAITGTAPLIKNGVGTLNLTGTNTYSGGTTLNQGTLTVGAGGTLGATTGALAVNNDNTVAAGTATVLNLATAVDTTVGSLSGSIAIPTPASPANTATINNGGAGRIFTVNQTVAGTFSGVIAGDGGLTLGALSTNTLTLTGINTYTGATSVTAGTLALVGGSQASPITVNTGASLSFTLGSPTTSTSTFNLTNGTIKITGTATLPSYTLITTSTGITGTPVLNTPIAGYSLVKYGNTLKLETPYGTWSNGSFANAFTQTGLEDDPDGDGIKNLMEYAFGTDPTVSSTTSISYSPSVVPGQPVLQEDGGIWYAVFGRRADYVAAGLTYTVQFSSALSSWEATATAPTVLATDGVIDAVRVPFLNFVDILGPNGPQKPTFFRVQVSE